MAKRTIIYLATMLAIVACNTKKTETPPPPTYPVIVVSQQDVTGFTVYPTEIESKSNVMVRPKISGYVKKIFIDEGQQVKAGQPLFQLETNVQSQNASSAQAQVSAAKASIKAAEANVKSAQVEVDKLIPLVEKGIISNVQLETAQANLLKAKSQLSQAKANAQVANASYQGVNENLKFATVSSLIAGTVGKINVSVGDLVGPTDPKPLTNVSDASEIEAYVTLNEKQYISFFQNIEGANLQEKLEKLPEITLQLANGSDYEHKGKVTASTGQTDKATGTIRFRIAFPNPNGLLNNGSTGKIKVPRQYQQVVVIPESATFEQQGLVYAYKLDKDTTRLVTIEVADRVNNMVVVKSGIQANDRVVVSGVSNLKKNIAIKPQVVKMDSLLNAIGTIK